MSISKSAESTVSQTRSRPNARVSAYVELTKLRISIMVLVTFIVAAAIAASGLPDLSLLVFGTFGMLMVAASGNAMNMYIERYSDILMPRTANRPLPAQKLSATEVALFGTATLGIGLTILLLMVNWQTAACGLANWILYVFVYTPLKRKTWANTEIGAIAGAMPIIMGALATTATVPRIAWVFFAVLFFWQFPHFMAIAWKYRDQYKAGGLQMLTVVDPTGKRAGRKAIVTGILLLAVSLLPILDVRTTVHAVLFSITAIVLGGVYLKASFKFNASRDDQTAKRLLRVSLLYLPLYMVALIVACLT
jgi:protoheme IX farnesyltransferase